MSKRYRILDKEQWDENNREMLSKMSGPEKLSYYYELLRLFGKPGEEFETPLPGTKGYNDPRKKFRKK